MSEVFAAAGLTMGQLNALVKKMGGSGEVMRFLRDELVISEPFVAPREFPIWKTVKLGTHQSVEELRRAFAWRELVSPEAGWIIANPSFTVAGEETSVDLVKVSIGDLGFTKKSASREEIYKRAIKLGLRLCPAEVGPQLLLQYTDQPKGECLTLGMESISVGPHSKPFIFSVRKEDRYTHLGACWGHGFIDCFTNEDLIFCK